MQLDESPLQIIINMSEGNPGAIRVLMDTMAQAENIDKLDWMGPFGPMAMLDELEIYGSQIWVLFKDHCGENLSSMIAVLRGWQLGFIRREDVAAGRFNLKDIRQQVVERLGAENFILS